MSNVSNGTLLKVLVDSVAVATGTMADFSLDMAPRETTNKDSNGWAEFQEGKMTGKMSWKGFQDPASAMAFSDLFAMLKDRASVTIKFGPTTTGTKYYTCSAYATNVKLSGGVEDNQEISCDWQPTGAITEGTNA